MTGFTWPDVQHIYLSPHPDDAVLSCGGAIHTQAARGERVAVITLFAASPPADMPLSPFAESLHARWRASAGVGAFSDPPAVRRAEDIHACAALHPTVQVIHFPLSDCIYRADPDSGAYLYASEEAIFGEPASSDPAWAVLAGLPSLPEDARLYCPLAVGGHVDHRVTRCAIEAWGLSPDRLWYYEDYPYVLADGALEAALAGGGWQAERIPLTGEALEARIRAIAEHRSQISTFWAGAEAMREAIHAFACARGGERFWRVRGQQSVPPSV
ncbi:MAG: PIG-L family deacetylase [Anaerolineae bacterium]|nr:PIG-L family deacetylase [Anaerolineae bacterium]